VAVRRTRSEWAELIGRWARSGANAAEFSARWGLNPRTLQYWKWQLDRAKGAKPKSVGQQDATFTEVALGAAASAAPHVEVTLGDVTVRVYAGAAPDQVQAVLAALRGQR
jgi:hypothetical protein